jgi:cell cycle checkpoint protein
VFKTWLDNDGAILQRLLVLTGPAGSAKTTTLRVLAREMDFDIVEYKENMNTNRFSTFSDEPSTCTFGDSICSFLRC